MEVKNVSKIFTQLNLLMLKKEGHPDLCIRFDYFCKVIQASLIGQRYVDEFLHSHIGQIY